MNLNTEKMTTTKEEVALGRLLFDEESQLASVLDYGGDYLKVLNGDETPKLGHRVNMGYKGELRGEVNGSIEGMDHIEIRPDGMFKLNIHATITTYDGKKIAYESGGIVETETGEVRQHVWFRTQEKEYLWLNKLYVWVIGKADFATGTLTLKNYVAA
ncbi:DUF3237 family protein [Maribacter sp. 2307ULW6-5]|uniref:DUF3237 family protein n=1 Tax=Maribacter sp. 2307ULW6-5 TaxID=3386275 RepID=UPI0039BC5A59